MARTRLGIFIIGVVSLVLAAVPVRADEKALQKQLDELNVLTGGEPTSGALRGLLNDPKQLKELLEFATQPQFVRAVAWKQPGDLVIWDNRCTMHRATAFEDTLYRRDMRRTTVFDPTV